MEGPWTVVYKIQSNSGVHPLEIFSSSGTQQEKNASYPTECMAMVKVPGCSTPYRAGLIDDWGELEVQEVNIFIW
jgi:hypothetical protein